MPPPNDTVQAPAGAKPTVKLDANHHARGVVALTPGMLGFLVIVCAIAYFVFSVLQITSTEQAVFNLLQVSLKVTPQMTGEQVQSMLNGSLDRDHQIASGIGWAVQIALLLLSFPEDSVLLMLHKRFGGAGSTSLDQSAVTFQKWRTFCTRVLIGGDVLTDFAYVMQGRIFFSGSWPFVSGLNGGALIVGLVYPVAICFVTVFVGKALWVFLEGFIDKIRTRNQVA